MSEFKDFKELFTYKRIKYVAPPEELFDFCITRETMLVLELVTPDEFDADETIQKALQKGMVEDLSRYQCAAMWKRLIQRTSKMYLNPKTRKKQAKDRLCFCAALLEYDVDTIKGPEILNVEKLSNNLLEVFRALELKVLFFLYHKPNMTILSIARHCVKPDPEVRIVCGKLIQRQILKKKNHRYSIGRVPWKYLDPRKKKVYK